MKKLIVVFLLSTSLVYAGEYMGEIWSARHGNGTSEYVLDTSRGLPSSVYNYVLDNDIRIQRYCYLKMNKKNIIKCEMSQSFGDIIVKQNHNSISNKNMKRMTYLGNGKSFSAQYKKWSKGEDL